MILGICSLRSSGDRPDGACSSNFFSISIETHSGRSQRQGIIRTEHFLRGDSPWIVAKFELPPFHRGLIYLLLIDLPLVIERSVFGDERLSERHNAVFDPKSWVQQLPRSFAVIAKEAIGGILGLTWSIVEVGGRPPGTIQT